jgi:hypothetical protein
MEDIGKSGSSCWPLTDYIHTYTGVQNGRGKELKLTVDVEVRTRSGGGGGGG